MNNKEIKLSILNDDDALPKDIKVSDAEKERIFKMSQRMYDMKKKSDDTNYDNANEASGVERYRRPKWYRAVSFAAAFVIAAAGIGGSALMIMNMRNTPNISTRLEDETEPTESEESEEAAEPEIVSDLSYDMSTKEGIYNKMLNSMDFYDRISGKYIHSIYYNLMEECDALEFSVDLDACESYRKSTVVLLNNPDEFINGAPADTVINQGVRIAESFIDYCDGERFYRMANDMKWISEEDPNVPEMIVPKTIERDRNPYTAEDIEAIKDWYYNSDEENNHSDNYFTDHVRTRRSQLEHVFLCDFTSHALNRLTNFDSWDIKGEETFAGRDCVVIEGIIEKEHIVTVGEASFVLYVDKETGFVVKFYCYGKDGQLKSFDVFEEIYFDDDAEMVYLNVDDYETQVVPEYEDPQIPKVNSKGETYGVAAGSRAQSPDLIAIDVHGTPLEEIVGYKEPAYYRRDEFLGTFIDGEEAFRMQAELGNVSDTAVAVNINLYTKEGEFIGTRTFYTEPENLIMPAVNSNGETYGNASIGMYRENYDKLPDLIAVDSKGKGFRIEKGNESYIFFRKDEFFNKFINGKDVFVEPSDTSVEAELNVYDQEGEFYGTFQFYSELDNIK